MESFEEKENTSAAIINKDNYVADEDVPEECVSDISVIDHAIQEDESEESKIEVPVGCMRFSFEVYGSSICFDCTLDSATKDSNDLLEDMFNSFSESKDCFDLLNRYMLLKVSTRAETRCRLYSFFKMCKFVVPVLDGSNKHYVREQRDFDYVNRLALSSNVCYKKLCNLKLLADLANYKSESGIFGTPNLYSYDDDKMCISSGDVYKWFVEYYSLSKTTRANGPVKTKSKLFFSEQPVNSKIITIVFPLSSKIHCSPHSLLTCVFNCIQFKPDGKEKLLQKKQPQLSESTNYSCLLTKCLLKQDLLPNYENATVDSIYGNWDAHENEFVLINRHLYLGSFLAMISRLRLEDCSMDNILRTRMNEQYKVNGDCDFLPDSNNNIISFGQMRCDNRAVIYSVPIFSNCTIKFDSKTLSTTFPGMSADVVHSILTNMSCKGNKVSKESIVKWLAKPPGATITKKAPNTHWSESLCFNKIDKITQNAFICFQAINPTFNASNFHFRLGVGAIYSSFFVSGDDDNQEDDDQEDDDAAGVTRTEKVLPKTDVLVYVEEVDDEEEEAAAAAKELVKKPIKRKQIKEEVLDNAGGCDLQKLKRKKQ